MGEFLILSVRRIGIKHASPAAVPMLPRHSNEGKKMTLKHTLSHDIGKPPHRPCSTLFTLFIFLAAAFGYPCFGFASDAPKISISPASLNFGNVRVGGTPELSTIITNTGTSDLTVSEVEITGLNISEFSQTNNCTTIPPGGSCTMMVTFSPALPYASKSAVVGIHCNDPGKPIANVKLKGKAPPPKISVSPRSVDLGPARVGSTSLPKTVTILNKGSSDLVLSGVNIDGINGSEFGQENECATILAGASCTITATFSPGLPFGKKSAVATISSNDPKKPSVTVNTSGTAAPPKISVSPTSVPFGSVQVGGTSSPRTVTVSNIGVSDLLINDISIAGEDAGEFNQTDDCSILSAGSSCTVTATFAPTLTGSESAIMIISSNDPAKPAVNVKLSGAVDTVAVWDSATWDNFKWDD
jgi:hypothetical protein